MYGINSSVTKSYHFNVLSIYLILRHNYSCLDDGGFIHSSHRFSRSQEVFCFFPDLIICILFFAIVVVQLLNHVWLFAIPWTIERQASLSFTISQSLLKLMSIVSVRHRTISSSVVPFSSCPQTFPASGSFPMTCLFASVGQSIGASASTSVNNAAHYLRYWSLCFDS